MGRRRYKGNYAALKVVQNKLRGEDYVIVTGHGSQKTRHLRMLGQATNEAFEDALNYTHLHNEEIVSLVVVVRSI